MRSATTSTTERRASQRPVCRRLHSSFGRAARFWAESEKALGQLQPESVQDAGFSGIRAGYTPEAKISLVGGLEDHTGAL